MTDIWDRLRNLDDRDLRWDLVIEEAANEGERLREQLKVAHAETLEWIARYNESETPDQRDAELERLRGLLREASGPMSHGRWSTDFRREVKDALGDSDDSEGRGQIATPPLPVSISYKLLEAENERLRGLVAKYEEYLGEEAERAARVVRALGDE
jgi:hypothetical protein